MHELAHVAAARGFGMRVHSVTLHLLGGETSIEGESRRPFQELWIAIVGPLTSAAIGVVALAVGRSLDGTSATLLAAIGLVNLLVAAFNMIPGLPLDGGRVLRALIWGVTGREVLGIRVAAWIGRLTAVVAVVWAGLRPRDETYAVDLIVAALVALVPVGRIEPGPAPRGASQPGGRPGRPRPRRRRCRRPLMPCDSTPI